MEMQTTTSGITSHPKSIYYRISGEKCVCNGYCSFCTCHCCVFCMMVGWTIFASLGVWVATTVLVYISDGEWYTSSCIVNDSFHDDCCVGNDGIWGSNAAVNITGVDCNDVETVYTVSLVDNIR